jgi:hypothetical protein
MYKKGYHKAILSIFLIILVSFIFMQLLIKHNNHDYDDDETSITGFALKESVENQETRPIQDIHKELEEHGWARVVTDKEMRYTDDE